MRPAGYVAQWNIEWDGDEPRRIGRVGSQMYATFPAPHVELMKQAFHDGSNQLKQRHEDCDMCDVIKEVMVRLERIQRGTHTALVDPLDDANNCIATMQNEAKMAWAELRPLVWDMKSEANDDTPMFGRSQLRHVAKTRGDG